LALKIKNDLSTHARGVAAEQYLTEEILEPAAATTEDMLSVGLQPAFTSKASIALRRTDLRTDVDFLNEELAKTSPEGTLVQRLPDSREREIHSLWRRYTKPAVIKN
ncbi:MAG: hypothetical protein RBT63_05485, partial [Bdellovibrionales bacterium]|nr:hypothetical protein [Bdellovibrionales bacterium]